MVKKQLLVVGGLTSLFSSNKQQDTPGAVLPCHSSSSSIMSSSSSSSGWQWTSCGMHPRTLSFRQEQEEAMSSAYSVESGGNSADSFSTTASDAEAEAVISALRSDRLFFEPEDTSCFKASCKAKKLFIKAVDEDEDKDTATMISKSATEAFGGGMATSVESENPYRDFRESMEAMVMSKGGVKDWRWLEEMLGWYLRANGKNTHGLIVGAFVDLLVALSSGTSPADSSSPATPAAANRSASSDCSCSYSSL